MPVGRVKLQSQHRDVSSTDNIDSTTHVTAIIMAMSHHDSARTLVHQVQESKLVWCLTLRCCAGLQAILPDALLMAVAAARPSSASALVAYAKEALKKLNRGSAQRDAYEALPQHVPACFCQQSEQVCGCISTTLMPI